MFNKKTSRRMDVLSNDLSALRLDIGYMKIRVGDLQRAMDDISAALNPPPAPPNTTEELAAAEDGALLTGAAVRDVASRLLAVEKKTAKRGRK